MRFFLLIGLLTGIAFAESPVAQLDTLIAKNLQASGQVAAPKLDDYAIARRLYLSILGRIPTEHELEAFIANPNREQLIETLFTLPGRVSHDYNFWADLLRLTDSVPGVAAGFGNYANWLKQALHENLPYDEFVRTLVSSQGFVGENGAVGFYLRDRGMPLDHLANTAQVFLGTRLVCAQCHDHPFEDWTQMDFYQLAAFSAPVEVRSVSTDLQRRVAQASNGKDVSLAPYVKPFRNSYAEETETLLRLPHNYPYDDGKPNKVVSPQTPFGDVIALKPGESRQAAYAAWMTSSTNPRFARVIANRIWKRTMGIGLTKPVDDLDAGDVIGDPELFDFLEKLIIDLEFDILAFRKTLYLSDVFQRQSVPYDPTSGTKFAFPGPVHQRLTAEQIWDSIGILVRPDFEETFALHRTSPGRELRLNSYRVLTGPEAGEDIANRAKAVADLINQALEKTDQSRAEIEALIAKKDAKGAAIWLEELISENERDLAQLSELAGYGEGPEPAKRIANPFRTKRLGLAQLARGSFPELKERVIQYFFRETPERNAMAEREAQLEAEFQEHYQLLESSESKKAAEAFRIRHRQEQRTHWAKRASELGNPSPETHFLRELGQSDRILIANGKRDSAIPQLLAFRNGTLVQNLNNRETQLWRNLQGLENPDDLITSLYRQMLTRLPTEAELELLRPEFEANRDQGIQSTIWVLLNSIEFLFAP